MESNRREITNPAVLQYIGRILEQGTTLSKLILDRTNLACGKVFTFMPLEITLDRLMPSNPRAYNDWLPISKPALPNRLFVEYLTRHLCENPGEICVFAEVLMRAGEAMSDDEKKLLHTYESEVYFILTSEQLQRSLDVQQLIQSVLGGWGAIITLTSFASPDFSKEELTRQLSQEQLQILAKRSTAIVVRAYDGGGVLVWQR